MSSATQSVPVTVDNFMRAESDWAFDGIVKQGGFGKTFQLEDGGLFYSAAIQGFWNAAKPEGVGDWMVIAQFQVIFGQ